MNVVARRVMIAAATGLIGAVCLVVVLSLSKKSATAAATRSGAAPAPARRSAGRVSKTVTVTVPAASAQLSAASHNAPQGADPPAPAAGAADSSGSGPLPLAKAVGQTIIATYQGPTPPVSFLRAIRMGQIGAVILMGDNTVGGVNGTRAATDELQRAARAGGNAGLLIMTDQEGGEVKRLPGPPAYPAAGMSNPSVAREQGLATAGLLKRAGVNVDLAPVADVTRVDGFMTQEQRTFGDSPAVVAAAACSFADALASQGVAYTLKHFPGLGDAVLSTDNVPVAIDESAAGIYSDDAAYRRCGAAKLAVVMVSSASYSNLTGTTPAVLSPRIYRSVMKRDGIDALAISDSFESGAIQSVPHPAMTALNAGLDMVMYPGYESVAFSAYSTLMADAQAGLLLPGRVQAAARRVLTLKQRLGLS